VLIPPEIRSYGLTPSCEIEKTRKTRSKMHFFRVSPLAQLRGPICHYDLGSPRIVLNAALMIRRKRTSPRPETGASDDARWRKGSHPPNLIRIWFTRMREAVQLINGMLGKMKPALRLALTMTYYDELSGPEACAILGVSAGTFKAQLFRARRQLLNQTQRAL